MTPGTVTSPFLDRLGFIINSDHHTLICMTCRISVDHRMIHPHFRVKRHNSHNPKPDIQQQLDTEILQVYPQGLVYPPAVPSEPVDIIYGLAPPLHDFVRCSECTRWFKSKASSSSSFRLHQCTKGQPNPHHREQSEPASVQCFSHTSAPGAIKFAVRIPTAPQPLISILAQYQQQCANRPLPPSRISLPENHRVLNQFLNKEGWIQCVDGLLPARIFELFQVTLKDAQFPSLSRHIERYLLDVQNSITSYHARRLISTRPSTE